MMDSNGSKFSNSYHSARIRLLSAFANVDGGHHIYANHLTSAEDEEPLTTDVLVLDQPNKGSALVLVSGTHGVEGYCGSGAQVQFLHQYAAGRWRKDCTIVIVHAINPYGMANDRRVNEDNVDINRNFIDFGGPLPVNAEYDGLHAAVLPAEWYGAERNAADRVLDEFIAANGQRAFQGAILNGQYTHADGLFYGGSGPVWSNATWRNIIDEHLRGFAKIALIDFHTGLGPFGYGEPIYVGQPGAAGQQRAVDWYGDDVTSPADGTSASTNIQGPLGTSLELALPAAEVTSIALEFGTLEIDDVINALRADNWLYVNGEMQSQLGQRIKRQIRDAFYPHSEEWKSLVLDRSELIIARALEGLGNA